MTDLTVLIVDDDDADRKLLRRLIGKIDANVHIHEVRSQTELTALELPNVDAIFLDYMLPDTDGLSLLGIVLDRWPSCAVMLMTGQGNEELAKSAIIQGAMDYIAKRSLNANAIARMLENSVNSARLRWRLHEQRLEQELFSDILVHDLKAPIRSVNFFADQIEEALEAGDETQAREALHLTRNSTRQMRDLIESLADHIRLDRDKSVESIAIPALVDRALLALHRDIEDTGARIALDSAAASIQCNVPQIAQMLQNLIGNAIKFSGDRTPDIRIEVTKEAENLHFRIHDNGIGVPAAYRARIFEPFKRLGSANGPAGSGLGLATCRKIVDRHGGMIWCESVEGEGSTMHVVIPSELESKKEYVPWYSGTDTEPKATGAPG